MSRISVLQWSESDRSAILQTHGRTSETILQDIENIKAWMSKQPHLPEIPDDTFIENSLTSNKFRIEKVKKMLDMYYSVRSIIPEFYYMDPNGPAIQNLMDVACYIPMPTLTKELERLVVVKLKNADKELDPIAYISYVLNIAEIRIREDNFLKEIYIYDLEGIKLSHLTKLTPSHLKKANFVYENVFTTRIKSIHLINVPSFVDAAVTLIKSVLSDKLSQRINVHKNVESLHKLLPISVLPLEYGGEERPLEELNNEWKKIFLDYNDVLQRVRKLRVDETKRQGDRPGDEFLELQGNFRQLIID